MHLKQIVIFMLMVGERWCCFLERVFLIDAILIFDFPSREERVVVSSRWVCYERRWKRPILHDKSRTNPNMFNEHARNNPYIVSLGRYLLKILLTYSFIVILSRIRTLYDIKMIQSMYICFNKCKNIVCFVEQIQKFVILFFILINM